MKRNYYENEGRVKSCIKYYKRKYPEDEEVKSILQDETLSVQDKQLQLKIFNIKKKSENL